MIIEKSHTVRDNFVIILVFAADEIRRFYFLLFFLTGLVFFSFFSLPLSVFVLSILYYLMLVFMFSNAFNKIY